MASKPEEVPYIMWTQRDGTLIRVVDMDDKHLFNTIKMFERKAERVAAEYNRAIHWEDDYYESTSDDYLRNSDKYNMLVTVARARGIKV